MLKPSKLKNEKDINNGVDIKKSEKKKEEETIRFVADFRNDPKGAKTVREIFYKKINGKDWGEEVSFAKVVLKALPYLSKVDIKELQEDSRTHKESVKEGRERYNKENKTKLSKDEYTCLLMKEVEELKKKLGGEEQL